MRWNNIGNYRYKQFSSSLFLKTSFFLKAQLTVKTTMKLLKCPIVHLFPAKLPSIFQRNKTNRNLKKLYNSKYKKFLIPAVSCHFFANFMQSIEHCFEDAILYILTMFLFLVWISFTWRRMPSLFQYQIFWFQYFHVSLTSPLNLL